MQTLWGTLMGGGAGVEYYFGYQFVENDLICEDWRSRDKSWDYCRIAIDFFRNNNIPIADMQPADELVGNPQHDNSKYCLAKPGEIYLVYVAGSKSVEVDLSGQATQYNVSIFNPRDASSIEAPAVTSGSKTKLTLPDAKNDWLIVLRK